MHPVVAIGVALTLSGLGGAPPQAITPQAENSGAIVHEPPRCMDSEKFPLIEVRAPEPIASGGRLSVRFRAEDDSGWYETPLIGSSEEGLRAALPKPLPQAVRVVYYIASERPPARTPEYRVNVLMGGCPGALEAPAELVEEIRVHRTASDQDEIPRGFSPDGIRAGGASSRTTLGIVAGAAGGASIAALVATGDEPAANPPPNPEPPGAIRACFTPDPIPDIESGDTILFDASCTTPETVTSYQWSFGDGTTGQGSSVEHLFRPGGIYSVALTVSDGQRTDNKSRLVRVIATPTACFITAPDPPRIGTNESINFNADCSVGDRDGGRAAITTYSWDFGDGRSPAEGRFVSRQFPRPDLYGVTLTVTNEDGRQDQTTQFVVVLDRGGTSGTGSELRFMSQLELPPGTAAQIALNDGASFAADPPSPREYRARGRRGENVVEGRLIGDPREPGRWRFDFASEPGFVPGSLRVESGQVLALDDRSVVFRVEGGAPPIRFRFRLDP